MAIVKYKLEQGQNGEGLVPIVVTNGGHMFSSLDDSLLGWADETQGDRFRPVFTDNIIRMTESDVVDRALTIHAVAPFKKIVDDVEVEMTEAEVRDTMAQWYSSFYLENAGVPYTPSNDEVNVERERRIEIGCNVSINNVGTIYVTGRPEDIRNMAGLGQGAMARIMIGDTTTIVPYRDGYDVVYSLAPSQMLELWQKSAGYVSSVYQASWELKANTIPLDYKTNDAYWPSKEL